MIKILQKMDIGGTYLNIVKAIYDKPTANIILNIPPKIRNKTRVSTLTTIIQHSLGSPSYGNQRRKRNKRNPDWKKKEVKLSMSFVDDMILYIGNPKDHQKITRANQ